MTEDGPVPTLQRSPPRKETARLDVTLAGTSGNIPAASYSGRALLLRVSVPDAARAGYGGPVTRVPLSIAHRDHGLRGGSGRCSGAGVA
jgi:hypothetical protein